MEYKQIDCVMLQNPPKSLYSLLVLCLVSAATADILTSINTFNAKLSDALFDTNTNLVCSPFGAHLLLSIIYQTDMKLGNIFQKDFNFPDARATAKQYKNVLAALNSPSNVTILVANALYVSNTTVLAPGYTKMISDYFSANVQSVDFDRQETAEEINDWVKANTNNKIDKLVSPDEIKDDASIMLLNAIYFKGLWKNKFDKGATHVAKFYVSDTETVDCQMMHRTGLFSYSNNPELDAQVLKLDYQDERYSMVIILPNDRTGLDELEKTLASKDISSLVGLESEVDVWLPRFKIESTLDLKDPLKEIGLKDLFRKREDDFSSIVHSTSTLGKRYMTVTKVAQKVLIEVNEEGTEAAAGTDLSVYIHGIPALPPPIFNADHPFVYYVTVNLKNQRDNHAVIFTGKLDRASVDG